MDKRRNYGSDCFRPAVKANSSAGGIRTTWTCSLLPLMLIGLPRYYGILLSFAMGLPQHTGLAEDVLDHRLNARAFMMGPVLRFTYSITNYHIEHHMFPMVPHHRLPALYVVIRHNCPPPYRSLWQVWIELILVVFCQLLHPEHFIDRSISGDSVP